MTSINTNIAATTALRTLQSTNMQLDQTQSRISTGLKIGEAKDNAAYWSISTTLKSDNKALGTVKDALALGAATVDTAYQGLNETLSVLNEIVSKLTAATNGNVDKKAVQAEIEQLQSQLEGIAGASSFSGENWLSLPASALATADEKSIVSGFTRQADRSVTLSSIEVSIGDLVLMDLRSGETGLLQGTADTLAAGDSFDIGALFTTAAPGTVAYGTGAARVVGVRDEITFSLTPTSGTATVVTIDHKLVNDTLKVTDGKLRNAADFEAVLDAAIAKAGLNGVDTTLTVGSGSIAIANATITTAGIARTRDGVLNIDIETALKPAIENAIRTVNTIVEKVTDGASKLGAVAKRIELQQSFVSNLMDTIDAGVSGLIDADMNEESTRLQALQVKQQLGVQALSIANQSAQNVLSLFR